MQQVCKRIIPYLQCMDINRLSLKALNYKYPRSIGKDWIKLSKKELETGLVKINKNLTKEF